MVKLGEFGDYVVGIEMLVGFAVGLTFYWEASAAIIELGIFRIVIDWDTNES